MFPKLSRELVCILSLSVCFMLLFAADYSMVNMQKIVVSSIADDNPGFEVEGYTVTGITYTMFAITLWFGPYINYAVGTRLTMAISALGYLFYVGSYAMETEWAIYAGGVSVGIAAGTLWPAQGHYMIENSSPETTPRNVGIFWFIFMSSNMLGNIFVYFAFHGKKYIGQTTRRTAIYSLIVINTLAVISFMFLPKSASTQKVRDYGPIKTMRQSWRILVSPKMLWLVLTFCYTGLQQAFWNGIYSPSVGFTLAFGDSAKELVALSGIFMTFGAVFGALCLIVLSGWIRGHRYARRMFVLAGCTAQMLAYLISYINLPNSAVFGNTHEQSLITPSAKLAMTASLLLCFGDSCLSTQIYSLIGDFYRESSAEACALYKFVKGVLVAVSFYWCSHLGLHTQLVIIAVMAVVGGAAFFVADRPSDVSHPVRKDNIVSTSSNGYENSKV
ncbi:UNC93-like protein MFSD11 [Homalodisca vitripennis]|uniref:UNC93-like protein MFSD11 n=1 Tax=Homalodisca vitripennis TaxID=197043 RepID=UPI001EECE591|nr:UNC93-like protein MFSD11 [Homalodisca vitripennis]